MARWWLIGGGAALGALLIASIALALTNRPADFAPGTPEAAVQALLRAAAVDDFEAAYRLLASELRADCSSLSSPPRTKAMATDALRPIFKQGLTTQE